MYKSGRINNIVRTQQQYLVDCPFGTKQLVLKIEMGNKLAASCCQLVAHLVHRSCMCSYLTVDDHLHKCETVDQSLLQCMNDKKALLSQQDFLDAIDREASIINKDNAKVPTSLGRSSLVVLSTSA
jgi:hypothetical protein